MIVMMSSTVAHQCGKESLSYKPAKSFENWISET